MDGDPLIVLVIDNGAFSGRLVSEVRSLDSRLQILAGFWPRTVRIPQGT
jgi:hypothetical protein